MLCTHQSLATVHINNMITVSFGALKLENTATPIPKSKNAAIPQITYKDKIWSSLSFCDAEV